MNNDYKLWLGGSDLLNDSATRIFDTQKPWKPDGALFFCQFYIMCVAYHRTIWYNILMADTTSGGGDG